MDTCDTSFQKKKRLLYYLGLFTPLIWVCSIVTAFILHFLAGYNAPEELLSIDSISSAFGYSCLINNIFYPIRKGDKLWKLRFAINLIIGLLLIILGMYGIIFTNPNVFTYICLLVGAAIIIFSAKNISV